MKQQIQKLMAGKGNLWIYMRPKDRRPLAFYEDSIAIQRCAMTFELYVKVCGVD